MTPTTYRQSFGAWGERQAEEYLLEKGLYLIERNYRTPSGEIDLVMSHGEQLVFVEVKTRANKYFGMPEDSVTTKKKEHLTASALYYLGDHSVPGDNWRIDVVAICGKPGDPALEIIWFENALA